MNVVSVMDQVLQMVHVIATAIMLVVIMSVTVVKLLMNVEYVVELVFLKVIVTVMAT
jgi:hypothetical protein